MHLIAKETSESTTIWFMHALFFAVSSMSSASLQRTPNVCVMPIGRHTDKIKPR
jgi:hypothetical protein